MCAVQKRNTVLTNMVRTASSLFLQHVLLFSIQNHIKNYTFIPDRPLKKPWQQVTERSHWKNKICGLSHKQCYSVSQVLIWWKNTLCCCFWPTLVHFFACKCAYMWAFVTSLDSGSRLTAFYAVFAVALYTRSGHCSPLWFPPGWAWLLWPLFAASFQWWRPGCCPAKATSPAKSVMDDVAADRSAGASSACN